MLRFCHTIYSYSIHVTCRPGETLKLRFDGILDLRMNQPSPLGEWSTAIHESAHAVAFVILGLGNYVAGLSIEQEILTLGYLKTHPGLRFQMGTEDPSDLATIEKICMGFLVAKQAEMKWLRRQWPDADKQLFESIRWQSGVTDVEQAVEVAAQRFGSNTSAEITAYLKYIWVRAKAFVDDKEHWHVIHSLAGKLLGLRKIDGPYIQRIVESARNEFFKEGPRRKPAPVTQMGVPEFAVLANGLLPDLWA